MKLIPFDIEKAKAGAKVVTREGLAVRMLCYDRKNEQPVISLVTHDDGREYVHSNEVSGAFFPGNNSSPLDLFLAVEPKLRPWKPEEVPMLAVVKAVGEDSDAGIGYHRLVILYVCPSRVTLSTADNYSGKFGMGKTFQELLDGYKHSTDGGKTWLPCGILE